MELHEAVIVGAVRTPIGKYGGALKDVRPDDLAAHVMRAVVDRSGIDPESIDDVYWGAANQSGEDNRNVARMALLLAGLPVEVPGATVNRLCGSGLQAVISAAREIQVGAADVVLAGGVESMTRAPYVLPKPAGAFQRGNPAMFDTTLGWRMVNPRMEELYPTISLGETAEEVAERYCVSREDQDEFALRSHQRAIQAQDTGRFDREITPLSIPRGRGEYIVVDRDESPRRDTSLDKLGTLKPVFKSGGSVTAGNSSPINDGASALLLMSAQAAAHARIPALARFVAAASAGVHPHVMGIGPVPATRRVLEQTGCTVDDIDTVELNEAFASQAIACIRALDLDPGKVNPNGGAIALGHPLGASGARLITTLVHQLQSTGGRLGLATMCVGVGQGISVLFERVDA